MQEMMEFSRTANRMVESTGVQEGVINQVRRMVVPIINILAIEILFVDMQSNNAIQSSQATDIIH